MGLSVNGPCAPDPTGAIRVFKPAIQKARVARSWPERLARCRRKSQRISASLASLAPTKSGTYEPQSLGEKFQGSSRVARETRGGSFSQAGNGRVCQIANALDVGLDWLMGRSDIMDVLELPEMPEPPKKKGKKTG
jgi:hypothetical protein